MQERVFKSGPARRRYSEAFKRELVERSLQPGASVSALALEQGMRAVIPGLTPGAVISRR